MSEQLSTQPEAIHTEIAGREIAIVEASNGQQRYYEVDAEGNKTRMSNQEFGAIAKTEENAQDTALFGRINEAIDNGSLNEFSAGADYRNATGLSREQVMARGHKGYKEVVEAAKDHKAAQETAAATKQAERAARRERLEGLLAAQALRNADNARIADFHASNRERAQEWRKEADALKDARSPETSALRDRLKTMSYKEKLELGGEQGIARLQQAAEKADEKHAAEEVRYHHVHKPSAAALESQAKTVAALKEFQRANLASSEQTNDEEKPKDVDAAEGLLNNEGVLDLDQATSQAEMPKPVKPEQPAKPAQPVKSARPVRPQPAPKRGVRKLFAAGVAAGAAVGLALVGLFGLGRNSADATAAMGLSQQEKKVAEATKDAVKAAGSAARAAAEVAEAQASKAKAVEKNIPTDWDVMNGRTNQGDVVTVTMPDGTTQTWQTESDKNQETTRPLERGSNPWDESRKMLEAYGLPTTEANIDAVDKAIVKRMGEIDYTRMPVGMQIPWFGEDRIKDILHQYDNTSLK
ncbi:MAG: hypothetical protein WBO35_06685 [Candidatus Saccharimonadales bacterium]